MTHRCTMTKGGDLRHGHGVHLPTRSESLGVGVRNVSKSGLLSNAQGLGRNRVNDQIKLLPTSK